nr:linoleate 10r-lipoxygenase [Quercus suber]POE59030.1 linoleate 10r-lipoxygenase [Quercus suber]
MPMTTPNENRKIMTHLGRISHYSWDRPVRQPGRVMIQNYRGVRQVLENSDIFKVINAEPFAYLYGDRARRFMLTGDGKYFSDQKQIMHKALYKDQWHEAVKQFYRFITLKLLREKSCKIAGLN